ncbi:DNA primase [candidate division WOR-1 bacterium RIFCSPHIGHO2_01_FULL_53_15]|uniref:DNA primase n=1 Tax=candidate division WOR-1 bacterium RIFCSPHIGHO2_01_FULL_53_15 TaxID=1802564 RepID=A0A1F4Q241_UNCSA|nr:MAG: DNA primase [candidate division WOR-1 bacterium RIFCSPHIGHO2_01_FULL_53_15]OGC13653.1 MAG: DNA primase [candidate division WOR-1 bacterium RIFCSPHIGHO2_02_FULL_53_26]
MIPPAVIEEIRHRSDIVAVISGYVALKKRGRNYLGLCPFHSEKTASFTVSPEKQLFHCFGCGEGGNVFAFLMKAENIGFAEAVAELGEKIGVKVGRTAPSTSSSEKEKIYSVMLLAAKFFRSALESEAGGPAREYLAKRKISEETAKTYGLGFAPASWDELFKHLISRGAAPELIERAGLTLPREGKDGYYDRFRSRLMFPVFDVRGRVIAFSGRALDNSEPKYLNSPDTPVYRKGDTVYGLNFAKDEIKKKNAAILVEGNVDVLSVFAAGFANVAAPLGTALTIAQCKLLSRSTDTIMLAFDADTAGEAAAERSAEIIRSQGMKVRIASFTGAKDPDELIKNEGAAAFSAAADAALPYLEFKIRRLLKKFNLGEIEARSQALRETAKLLAGEKDAFAQKEYAGLAAGLLKVEAETLMTEIKRQGYLSRGSEKNLSKVTEKPGDRLGAAEKKLIALSLQNEAALAAVKQELAPANFLGSEAGKIAEILFAEQPGAGENLSHLILDKLTDEASKNYLTGALLSEGLMENPAGIMRDCISVIKAESAKKRVDEIKSALREAEKANDNQKAAELIAALKNEIY